MRRHRRTLCFLGIFAIVLVIRGAADSNAANCSCGYYDVATGSIWTESIIVYFNETPNTPIPNFIGESYSHKYEKGWNTQFRTAADISNINFSNSTSSTRSHSSFDLYVSPYTSEHLVVGSGLRTSRRDIQYGSFNYLLRSPAKFCGWWWQCTIICNRVQLIAILLHKLAKYGYAFHDLSQEAKIKGY